MKVYVFAPYARWCPTFDYELEIMQDHLDAGDEVAIGACNASLPTCDVSPHHAAADCAGCVGRRLFGLTRLTEPIRQISINQLTSADRKRCLALPRSFASLEQVKEFTVNNFDLGMAALSSVITAYREPKPDLNNPVVARMLHRFLVGAFSVYQSTLNVLQSERFDLVYLLNGRMAVSRAVLRACQFAKTDCFTHERGWNLEHFSLHKNTLIHDLGYFNRIVHSIWDEADPIDRELLAADYYQKRAGGEGFNWRSFVTDQDPGTLPENWDASRKNVALFTSSDDEIAALGNFWASGPIYSEQVEGVRRIAEAFTGEKNMHLYIRVHPNMDGVDNSTFKELREIRGDNVTLILPDSRVSSYALLYNSKASITVHSRMGVEAAFWGIPSILVGHTPYRDLGSTYNPKSHDELMSLLRRDLDPNDKLGALKFGYYLRTYGRRARHFCSTGFSQGTYRSIELRETGMFAGLKEFLELRPRLSQFVGEISGAVNSVRAGGRIL